jgi:hypothetical protein
MMDYRGLAYSRRPEWEEQYRRIGCKSLHLTVYWKRSCEETSMKRGTQDLV